MTQTLIEPSEQAASSTRPLKLGFFAHVRTDSDLRGAHEELVRLFVGAEELGFDLGFVAQHLLVGGPEGSVAAPLVSLARVAAETDRIHLGTAIVTLPLVDPVHLAAEALTLDAISHGRLQLGLGTGNANVDKYAVYGADAERRHELFDEKLAVLFDALTGRPLAGTDQSLKHDGSDLVRRLWRSPGDVESARRTARTGLGALFGTATLDARTQQRPIIDSYLDEWRTVGPLEAPEELRDTLEPRLGGIRMVYPSGSRAQALSELGHFLAQSRKRIAKVKGVDADVLTDEEVAAGVNLKTGTPVETAEAIATDVALLPDVDYLIVVTNVVESGRVGRGAKLSADGSLEGLATIAQQVAPRLGWSPA